MNEVIIDGCNVAECDRYCKFDNRNEPNKCYSYISEGYNDCKPKEYQCFFYVKEIEKQLQRAKAELEQYKKSKQASYESMQEQWNNAVNENRLLRAALKNKNFVAIAEENERLKAENEKLKEWLENKEKAYNHLCNVNAQKKEQIKNLNYMLFEEKEMTTQEWKLKYKLANKERKFIQFKDLIKKRLNNYKQALEEIRDLNNKTVKIPIITDKINEVLQDVE